MTVRAAILDLDGTLIGSTGAPAAGVEEMMNELRRLGIKIAVASNKPGGAYKLRNAGLEADLMLTRSKVGANKGSPLWVYKACEEFSLDTNQVLVLGDSDNDMRTAVNARVVYFNAAWSNPSYRYGISVREPWIFPVMVREFFMKEVDWFWTISDSDGLGRAVTATAVVDSRGAGIRAFQDDLIDFLKERKDPRVGRFSLRGFVALHLLGSIYGSGLYRGADTWTTYPGSKGGINEVLGPILSYASKLFRERYAGDLFVRHTPAVDSGEARVRGEGHLINFPNQSNTVRLNEDRRDRIEGKRVLVVDDFETQGYSMECARNLLMQAGAADVLCVSVSKYQKPRQVVTPAEGYSWDPYLPTTHPEGSFVQKLASEHRDPRVLAVVRRSYRRLRETA